MNDPKIQIKLFKTWVKEHFGYDKYKISGAAEEFHVDAYTKTGLLIHRKHAFLSYETLVEKMKNIIERNKK